MSSRTPDYPDRDPMSPGDLPDLPVGRSSDDNHALFTYGVSHDGIDSYDDGVGDVTQPGRRRAPRPPRQEPVDDWVEYEQPRRRTRPSFDDDVLEELPHRRLSDRFDTSNERARRPLRLRDDRLSLQAMTDDGLEIDEPSPQRSRRPARPGQQRLPRWNDDVVEESTVRAAAIPSDIVTGIRPARVERQATRTAPRRRRQRNPAWQWQRVHLPPLRQMVQQATPYWLMAAASGVTLLLLDVLPVALPLWALTLLVPVVLLWARSDGRRHPAWRRAAIMLAATVGLFFPLVIVRQSYLRVPFVEWGNGTLLMPVLSTITVVAVLAVMAAGAAYLSHEDPEYAGILFLPAALLIPFFAGATEITGLQTALVIMTGICVVCGVAMIVASMLPNAFPTLVAPVVLALEFFVLPLAESTPIFPLGAGTFAKLLFFVVLSMTVGLTIAVPVMAVWFRQVRKMVVARTHGPMTAAMV